MKEEKERAITARAEPDVRGITAATGHKRGPERPPEVSPAQAADLQRDAGQIVQQLAHAESGDAMRTMDELSAIGVKGQSVAVRELDLLKTRLGAMMAGDGASGQIARDLAELRTALDGLSPGSAPGGSALSRALRAVPVIGRVPSPARAVKKIALRYEPVSRQVAVVESRLREGRAALAHDNLELRKLYESVEQQRPELARGAFFGQLVLAELEQAVEKETDAERARRLHTALADVATRVRDLHTMNEVCMQYLVSIEMTRQNNTNLSRAVDRTLVLGSNVVMVGLAIQVALSRQARVMEANERTREFLGNLVVTNAELVKRHTEEIGDVYKSPVIAMEKVAQAHGALVDAIESAHRLRAEAVTMSRQSIDHLTSLAANMNGRILPPGGGERFDSGEESAV